MTDSVLMEVDNDPQVGEKRKADKGKAPLSAADESKKNQMWVEKYRPSRLADVAAHKDIIDTISRLTTEDKLPHLLLYGPPGTGKTSTILAVARELYGASFAQMVLELNASDGTRLAREGPRGRTSDGIARRLLPVISDLAFKFSRISRLTRTALPLFVFSHRNANLRLDRGIDVVRNEIQSFASTMRFGSKGFKLIILDECDSMTKDAQFALRRIIEKYTKHTRFCLIGNYVSKVIPALQSRCTRFRFAPLGPEAVRERVEHVVRCEQLDITGAGVDAVRDLGAGDMRRTLNILQSSFLAAGDRGAIDADDVYAVTGQPRPADVEAIAGMLLNLPFTQAVEQVSATKTARGLALADICKLLCEYVFRLHMPPAARADLVSDLADVEHRLAYVTHERLQLLALVGAFSKAKEAIVDAAV
jgi:replication factor C subunit 3/5